MLAFSTLLARRRILLEWKSAHPPKSSSLMKDLILFLKLEKIKYCIRGSTQKFYETWSPLLSYFEKLDILPQDWKLSRHNSISTFSLYLFFVFYYLFIFICVCYYRFYLCIIILIVNSVYFHICTLFCISFEMCLSLTESIFNILFNFRVGSMGDGWGGEENKKNCICWISVMNVHFFK